jgi:hypothetical protein
VISLVAVGGSDINHRDQTRIVNEEKASSITGPNEEGFHISAQPLVRARPSSNGDELPATYDSDLLYVTARDPGSLFLYWDVNWRRLFARAGLSPRQVFLRIYREDGSVEGAREINPFLEHCFVEVVNAGGGYFCELGCLVGDNWTSLVRSGTAFTPHDRVSNDLDAQFATLPLHLSFQRMLDLFETVKMTPATLAESVGRLQEEARELRSKMKDDDWEHFVAAAGKEAANTRRSADLATLLKAAVENEKPGELTAEQLACWQKLIEQSGGSSRFA